MTAYAIQNTTIVSLLGDDPSNLSWQVQHARGMYLPLLPFRLPTSNSRAKALSCSLPSSTPSVRLVASPTSSTMLPVRPYLSYPFDLLAG